MELTEQIDSGWSLWIWQLVAIAISSGAIWKLNGGGVSYTVETLKALTTQNPENEWFFLMGADSLESFASWREPEEILRLAKPIVVGRPGSNPVNLELFEPLSSASYVDRLRELQVESPLVEVSSSNIRSRGIARRKHSLSCASKRRKIY